MISAAKHRSAHLWSAGRTPSWCFNVVRLSHLQPSCILCSWSDKLSPISKAGASLSRAHSGEVSKEDMWSLVRGGDAANGPFLPRHDALNQLDLYLQTPAVLGTGFPSRAKADIMLFFKFFDHQKQQLQVTCMLLWASHIRRSRCQHICIH